MGPEVIGVLGIIFLLVLLLFKIPVGISLLIVGLIGYAAIRDWNIGLVQLGTAPFDTVSSYPLSVIPLFVLMGMVLSYSDLGKDLFRAVDSWMGHLRGGLAMATIGTAAIFSAISGSVNATTATVAKITLPEMEKYKYKPSLSTACVAAGGTLGVLIPPSVVLIFYGILTTEPIGALLIAGIVPGILQIIIFMITISLLVRRDPSLAPVRTEKAPLNEKMNSIKSVWPFLLLFIVSIGGIYFGIFTPTEAAAIGAFGALIISLLLRRLDTKKVRNSVDDTVRLTAMIFLILIGATIFSQFLAISRIPANVSTFVSELALNRFLVLAIVILIYIILGLFMEGMAIAVLTLPIVYPLITSLGFDGVWFGIIMVMVINIGFLTPPLGISIFVIKGVAKEVPIQTIFKGAVPMVISMVICTIILIIFPQIATFLPNLMRN